MSTPLSKQSAGGSGAGAHSEPGPGGKAIGNVQARLVGAWLFVGIPLSYGIIQTVRRAAALFTG